MASPSTSTCVIESQEEFIAHAVLLGYENRGKHHHDKAFILAPPPGRDRWMPLVSVGQVNVLFLTTDLAGTFYGHQEGYDFIWDAAQQNYS